MAAARAFRGRNLFCKWSVAGVSLCPSINPKVNRVIKPPPARMAQSWMGSDFSNNDLAKSDSILNDDTRSLAAATEIHEGHTVYVIESIPEPAAPVVRGKQELKIRNDHIFRSETFFDDALEPAAS
jgi:hypothetical protein